MTSLMSRLRQPVLLKVLPWPHSSSWVQHSRSGQGWLCPLMGLGQAMHLPGPGPAQGSHVGGCCPPLSQALFAPSKSMKQEGWLVLPVHWDGTCDCAQHFGCILDEAQ